MCTGPGRGGGGMDASRSTPIVRTCSHPHKTEGYGYRYVNYLLIIQIDCWVHYLIELVGCSNQSELHTSEMHAEII